MTERETHEVWVLNVMSFKGTVPGAVHAYGVLAGPHDRNYKVCEFLGKKEADELNQHAKRMQKDWLTYEADEPAEVFMREEDLEECARVIFCFLSEPGSVLMRGMEVILNPSKVIEGPQHIKDRLIPIWELDESEASNNWTDVRRQAEDQWDEAVEELGLVKTSRGYNPTANLGAIVKRFPGIADEKSPCGYDASVTIETR